ncbi:uncharacterized protein LOC129791866 isoform X2 [Lutzomyia longipalpis]|uniref:uncharacterized protein LOC129791866 isoform X2 n=1 Tax=Lutzomyia longipalpis TaxID=7200 RepID=UPI00248432E1|nr:uncharacterized protein LOC129791866 isoform X2 [Lutzomyia longipalpis]
MEKDVGEFLKWLTSVGCPTEFIPSENKLKEVLRAKIFSVDDLKCRFRAAKEAREVRERNLRVDLCKIKKGNFLVDRRAVSWEYLQYAKLMGTKKEIMRVESRIKDLKNEYNSKFLELNERNSEKNKCRKEVESNTTKMQFYEINSSILEDKVKEATKAVEEYEAAMCPEVKENESSDGKQAFRKLMEHLKEYYAKAESKNEENAESAMWKGCENVLKGTPNSLVCQEILSHFRALLDASKDLQERNLSVQNEEKERLYEHNIGLQRLITNRLKIFIFLKHYSDKLKEITTTYVEKYAEFKDILCKKICYCSPQYITEYVRMLVIDAAYRGKLEFLKSEVSKYQGNSLENGTTQNLQKLKKDVGESHGEFFANAKKAEANIFRLKCSPEKLERILEALRLQVNGLKKKISKEEKLQVNSQMTSWMNHFVEKESLILRTEAVEDEDSVNDDAEISLDTSELIVNIPPYENYDLKLPITENCEKYAKEVLEGETFLRGIFKDTESLGMQIEETLKEALTYYNFLMDNPMRKYIPSSEKFNGHSYQEYETEFMLHYRQNSASD